jgi:hypothetical protein
MFETIGKYLSNAAEKTPNIIKASFNKASESIDTFKKATESADTFGKYLANREKPKNNVAGYGQLPPRYMDIKRLTMLPAYLPICKICKIWERI